MRQILIPEDNRWGRKRQKASSSGLDSSCPCLTWVLGAGEVQRKVLCVPSPCTMFVGLQTSSQYKQFYFFFPKYILEGSKSFRITESNKQSGLSTDLSLPTIPFPITISTLSFIAWDRKWTPTKSSLLQSPCRALCPVFPLFYETKPKRNLAKKHILYLVALQPLMQCSLIPSLL